MEGYKAAVKEVRSLTEKELSVKERIYFKQMNDVTDLNDLVTADCPVMIDLDFIVIVGVHNEKSDTVDYDKYLYVDKDGTNYSSGSEPLYTSVDEILEELEDAGETECTLKVMKKESPNYKGQYFMTATIV